MRFVMSTESTDQAPVPEAGSAGLPSLDALQQMVTAAKDEVAAAKTAADAAKTTLETITAIEKQVTESQRQTNAILTDSQAKLAEISTISTQVVAANTKVTDLQAVVATKSEHIQGAQEHADKVRGDLDRALTAATQQVVAIEGEHSKAQSTEEKAADVLVAIQAIKATADIAAASVSNAQKEAEAASTVANGLAEKAVTVEKRITDYEARLITIDKQCAGQLATINDLLRGATSAGLATAFDKRRQTFLGPNRQWQWIFVGSILSLVVLTVLGLVHVYNLEKVPEWDELARLWVARLPIAGALVWLALYASREAALAKRIEEDYGFKAAIAACFEGFRKQMSDIDNATTPNSQLAKLCENTLATIASPPGRIYAAHKLTVSPTDEIKDAAKVAASVAAALNTTKP